MHYRHNLVEYDQLNYPNQTVANPPYFGLYLLIMTAENSRMMVECIKLREDLESVENNSNCMMEGICVVVAVVFVVVVVVDVEIRNRFHRQL